MSDNDSSCPGASYQCFRGEWLLGLPGWFKIADDLGRTWACRELPGEGGNVFEPDDYLQIEARHETLGSGRIEEVSFWSESMSKLPAQLASFCSDQ
jgi:hypothetical protein